MNNGAATAANAGKNSSGSDSGAIAMSPRVGVHTPLAMKVPQPPRTGNPILDGDADARRECFMTIIDVLQEDSSEVLPTFNELAKRLRMKAKQLQCDGDKFSAVTVFGKTDEDFATSFILSKSDMTLNDLVKAKQHDDAAVMQLLQYMLQYAPNLRYPEEAVVKEVTSRVFCSREALMGQRLRKFKASGGFVASGTINWKKGAYELVFTAEVLTEIRHRSGDVVTADNTIRIDKAYTLHMNWDDFGAHLAKPATPNVNLAAFFKKGVAGPFGSTRSSAASPRTSPASCSPSSTSGSTTWTRLRRSRRFSGRRARTPQRPCSRSRQTSASRAWRRRARQPRQRSRRSSVGARSPLPSESRVSGPGHETARSRPRSAVAPARRRSPACMH